MRIPSVRIVALGLSLLGRSTLLLIYDRKLQGALARSCRLHIDRSPQRTCNEESLYLSALVSGALEVV